MLRAEETLEAEMRLPMVVLCSSCSDSVSVLDWSRLRRHDSWWEKKHITEDAIL